jgi:protein subunit release factor B
VSIQELGQFPNQPGLAKRSRNGKGFMKREIPDSEIKIEFYRASGPGGQHRNVTDSAVRIRHLPTGIVVHASENRSQTRNRETAMRRLTDALTKLDRKEKKRIPTRVPRSAIEKRITAKKRLAEKKYLRSDRIDH